METGATPVLLHKSSFNAADGALGTATNTKKYFNFPNLERKSGRSCDRPELFSRTSYAKD
jgi:hypothetical protein